jgi:hypothetical protein
MKKLMTLLVLSLLPTGAFAKKPVGEPITVFLGTATTVGGFTDPNKERTDSMKDLAEALGKKKNVTLVAEAEDAVIVLEVQGRSVREDSGSFTKAFGGKNEVKRVVVKLTVGDFSAELAGESAGGGFGPPGRGVWKKAAYKLADQIENWIEENRARLTK